MRTLLAWRSYFESQGFTEGLPHSNHHNLTLVLIPVIDFQITGLEWCWYHCKSAMTHACMFKYWWFLKYSLSQSFPARARTASKRCCCHSPFPTLKAHATELEWAGTILGRAALYRVRKSDNSSPTQFHLSGACSGLRGMVLRLPPILHPFTFRLSAPTARPWHHNLSRGKGKKKPHHQQEDRSENISSYARKKGSSFHVPPHFLQWMKHSSPCGYNWNVKLPWL